MDLGPLMRPRSVAVVGASQRAGRATRVVANLQAFGYAGRIFPINPRYGEVLGLPCYPDLHATPEPPDTVVVAIPAEGVPAILAAAAERGVRGAVVLSSGFGEAGAAGRERQAVIERLAAERGLLVCGPNCYGVFNIRLGAATFSADFTAPLRVGRVALISQSGGFSHAVAEHLMRERAVGLSYIVSCGNQAGVAIEDYLEFLVEDGDTEVIGAIVEGFKRGEKLRRVAAQAREAGKPIVVLKGGRSENARQAMLAHTGSRAGAPDVVEAVLRRSGMVQVASINEMIDTLTLLASVRPFRRPGWRVAVLSGLGGECGRVADVADRVGIDLPPLAPATAEAIGRFMPPFANPRNPMDGTGAMYEDPALFPQLVDTLLRDDAFDVLAINLRANVPRPGGWAPSRQFAGVVRAALHGGTDKLVLAFSSFAGGDLDPEVVGPLAEVGVPFLDGTETAMLAVRHAREHRLFLERRGERSSPPPSPGARGLGRPVAATPGAPVGEPGRSEGPRAGRRLGTAEAMRWLCESGIRVADSLPAKGADEAVRAADQLGYPVALRVDSPDIAPATAVGSARTDCRDASAVRRAVDELLAEVPRRMPGARLDGVLVQRAVAGGIEMIVGVKIDPVLGPAVVCGFGGALAEVVPDVAVRVLPLDAAEAQAMVDELRGRPLLTGVRGHPPADVPALCNALVALARLADVHRGRLLALDIDPLLVLDEGRGTLAVGWRIELA